MTHQGRRKMTPRQFGLAYAMILIRHPNYGVRKIAKLLQLTPTTVQTYLHLPEYQAEIDTDLIQKVTDRETQKEINYAYDIIDASFKLNSKRIKELTTPRQVKGRGGKVRTKEPTAADWEEARVISLEMLRIAKTEAEVKRALSAIQINIDNRKQTVNVMACDKCMDDIMGDLEGVLCGKCRERIMETIMASREAEVTA